MNTSCWIAIEKAINFENGNDHRKMMGARSLKIQYSESMEYGPGFVSTFLYYFVTTALVSTFVASEGLGMGISTGIPQQLGLVIGLFAGLLGGYFNRTISFSVPFDNKKEFKKTLDAALDDLGYHHASDEEEGVTVYQRSPIRQLLSGKVFVKFEENDVTIASRFIHILGIRRKLKP